MFLLEYKVKPKVEQIRSINKAIRTTQFVRILDLIVCEDSNVKGSVKSGEERQRTKTKPRKQSVEYDSN